MQLRNHSQRIQILPEHLIDQIKAGEVIERPASLLKELLENSLDADAKKIDIQIKEQGLELISVVDDGCGISFDDLPLAFCRHATSKIDRFEDIYALKSFGFRGEALASMASISRVNCTSIPSSTDQSGGKLEIHGGETLACAPLHSAQVTGQEHYQHGTSIFAKNLFYNTPVRLKFVKSKMGESNALKKIIQAFLLANPQVTFTVKLDNKEKQVYPASKDNDILARIWDVIGGKPLSQNILEGFLEHEGCHVRIFIPINTKTSKIQFLFANQRYFQDRHWHQSIVKTIEKYSGITSSPYIVFATIPPRLMDANIHPNKTQLKFENTPILLSLISNTIKNIFENKTKTFASNSFLSESPNSKNPATGSDKNLDIENFQKLQALPLQERELSNNSRPQTNNNTNVISLTNQYLLIKKEHDSFLIDSNIFPSELIAKNLNRDTDQFSDDDYIPFLIGPLYSLPADFCQEQKLDLAKKLRHLGLEIDFIGKGKVLFRSFPNTLADFPIESLLPFLLNWSITSPEDSITHDFQIYIQNAIRSKQDWSMEVMLPMINYCLKKYSKSSITPKGWIKLDQTFLAKMFKQK